MNELDYIETATQIIKIVEIKLSEKPYYRDDEIIFSAQNKDNKNAPPVEMTKKDIIVILNDIKAQLKKTSADYTKFIMNINKTIAKLV